MVLFINCEKRVGFDSFEAHAHVKKANLIEVNIFGNNRKIIDCTAKRKM